MSEENAVEEEVMDSDEEVAEEEEVDTNAEIREAFDVASVDEKGEDDIKMAMIGAGATFKNVTRLYNQYMIDAGFAISKADRNEIVEKTLEGAEFAEENDFASVVSLVVDAVQGATERSAGALIRAYAKKNELDCYTKPKGTGGGGAGFASRFYEFLLGNPDQEAAKAFIQTDEKTSDNVKKHEGHYLKIADLVNKAVAAQA
jgi:hypothetical protein